MLVYKKISVNLSIASFKFTTYSMCFMIIIALIFAVFELWLIQHLDEL